MSKTQQSFYPHRAFKYLMMAVTLHVVVLNNIIHLNILELVLENNHAQVLDSIWTLIHNIRK